MYFGGFITRKNIKFACNTEMITLIYLSAPCLKKEEEDIYVVVE